MQNIQEDDKIRQGLLSVINKLVLVIVIMVFGFIAIPFIIYYSNLPGEPAEKGALISP